MTVTANPYNRVWTEADLAELPADGSRYEIIDRRLYVVPPAGEAHQALGGSIFAQLFNSAPKHWRILYEIGLAIGDDRFIPDLIVIPPGMPLANADYNDVAVIHPQLVVEIASRSTQTTDAGDKMIAYARGGIRSYWRVARDGTIFVHGLITPDAYSLAAAIPPGHTQDVLLPFPMKITAPRPAQP